MAWYYHNSETNFLFLFVQQFLFMQIIKLIKEDLQIGCSALDLNLGILIYWPYHKEEIEDIPSVLCRSSLIGLIIYKNQICCTNSCPGAPSLLIHQAQWHKKLLSPYQIFPLYDISAGARVGRDQIVTRSMRGSGGKRGTGWIWPRCGGAKSTIDRGNRAEGSDSITYISYAKTNYKNYLKAKTKVCK